MRVNSVFKLFSRNRLAVSVGVAISIVALLIVATSFTPRVDRGQLAKQTNLVVRQLGHQLLLQIGDRTSRVRPVTEIKEGTFLLEFERDIIVHHDSLIRLSQEILSEDLFPSGYTVTVHECSDPVIVYGFQINNGSPDILACQGRSEPRGCYSIEIFFPDLYKRRFDYSVIGLVSGGLLLLCVTLLIGRLGKTSATISAQSHDRIQSETPTEYTTLGKFQFDIKGQRLLLEHEWIALTDKECRVLELLNDSFGELIPRETLMEKIWINEGVITGRSLDVFVSKLRKKLSGDSSLRITNVHGKGYKLEQTGGDPLTD